MINPSNSSRRLFLLLPLLLCLCTLATGSLHLRALRQLLLQNFELLALLLTAPEFLAHEDGSPQVSVLLALAVAPVDCLQQYRAARNVEEATTGEEAACISKI